MESLQSSSCSPFHLVLLCFVQQENNLDPVCKQIWAASVLAPESGEQGSDRQRNLSCLGPSQLDAGAEQELSTAPVLLSRWCSSSAPKPELASACTPVLPRQKEGGQTPKPSARGVRPDSCVLPDNYS